MFLDEPTSGLDSSSAMLVMQSMRTLVDERGITICSVIHQPRKTIFQLFDSLILLGVGGFVVYHGDVRNVETYFNKLSYELPPGESLADWLIDISSGRLAPTIHDDGKDKRKTADVGESSEEMIGSEAEREKARREHLYEYWKQHFAKLSKTSRAIYDAPPPFELPAKTQPATFFSQLGYQIVRLVMVAKRNWSTKLLDAMIIVVAVILVSLLDGTFEPTKPYDLKDLDYYSIAQPRGTKEEAGEAMLGQFPTLFGFAVTGNVKIIA